MLILIERTAVYLLVMTLIVGAIAFVISNGVGP